jgi:kinesin family protein 18/19
LLAACRLLKDSLRGNSRTAMVATISAAADQYHHSVNTLKYADRAKEIKTHVVQNVGSVERHITDYQNIIDNLQVGEQAGTSAETQI